MSLDRKPRTDSLFAELKRLGVADEFFVWLYREEPGYEQIHERLASWGCDRGDGAICTLIREHGLRWKVEQAMVESEATKDILPPDADERIRSRIKQHEFDLTFKNLSSKEQFMLLKLQEDRKRTEVDERKIALLEERAAGARKALETAMEAPTGGMTVETRAKIEEALNLL